MAQPYPISRQSREEAVALGSGIATYGPFNFKIFDIEDVEVWTQPISGGVWSLATVTVAKTSGAALDTFTITFPSAIGVTTRYKVMGKRIYERSAGVTKGTRLDPDALEKEFSKIAATLQELRRDVGRGVQVQFGAGYTIADGLTDGATLMKSGSRIVEGPNASQIQLAQGYAQAAGISAAAAASSAAAAATFDPGSFYTKGQADARYFTQSQVNTFLSTKADNLIEVIGGGLATGGGSLTANRVITVPKSTDAESINRTSPRDDVAMTPKGVSLALPAYNRWETIEEVSLTAAASYIRTGLLDFYELILDGSIVPSVGPAISINVSTDNGATWILSADQVSQQTGAGGGTGVSSVNTAGAIALSWVNVQAGADLVFFGGFYAFNKARRLRTQFEISTLNTVPQVISYRVDGWGSPAAPGLVARNAFRILPSGGTLAGQFTLFGKRG